MRKIMTVLFTLLVLCVGFAKLATAQSSTYPGPGMIYSTVSKPTAVNGIEGSILDGYGRPVKDAELVLSAEKLDNNYNQIVDHATTKRIGQCLTPTSDNCIRGNGYYHVDTDTLPRSGSNTWWWVNVRAEAPGYIHAIWDFRHVQIQLNGRMESIQTIYMYDYGFKISSPTVWWVDQDVIAVGMWVDSTNAMDVIVNIDFSGSSWTKSSVNYNHVSVYDHVDFGLTYVQKLFYGPPNSNMSYYNGSFCAEVQITPTYNPKWVYDSTAKVCVAEK